MDDEQGTQLPESGIDVDFVETPEPQSGAEGLQTEPGAGEPGGMPEGTPTPEPAITRAQFDEAVAGITGQYQQQFDQMNQTIMGMYQVLNRLGRTAQPQPQQPKPIPDFPEFADMFAGGDSWRFHQLLTERERHWGDQVKSLTGELQSLRNRYLEDQRTNEIYSYYQGLINQATEEMPIFKDQFAKEQLEHYIAAKANQNKRQGRPSQPIDVMGIARRMSDHWNAMADRRYREKIGAQPQPPAPGQLPTQPLPPGTRPPSGSATRPGPKPLGEVKNFEDLERVAAERLPGIHAQAMEELGLED